jgi:hypothetical protein
VAGDTRSKNRFSPVMVPPEPTPQTMASTVAHLLPDLRRGGGLVRQRIGRVVELVDVEGVAAGLLREAGGHVLVILGMALGHVRARCGRRRS